MYINKPQVILFTYTVNSICGIMLFVRLTPVVALFYFTIHFKILIKSISLVVLVFCNQHWWECLFNFFKFHHSNILKYTFFFKTNFFNQFSSDTNIRSLILWPLCWFWFIVLSSISWHKIADLQNRIHTRFSF